ncbi:hypothetical protein NQ318_001056 [Aromia moschata]|uniref:FHA domain-containing protein n=1 Tax=Aromia moschata TaxID=1265417 RepID=A0AAV8ZGH0_9CUCU|nr:hypothetical protein NQ318_001056 [Aromia moschata]
MSVISDERSCRTSENSCDESVSRESRKSDSTGKGKYELSPSLKEKLKEIPEAMEYIETLHKLIKKQIKKISKWRSRIKKLQKPKDSGTQTDSVTNTANNSQNTVKIDVEQETKSLAEEIKEAAEMATQNSGFVFEETSGMYYDYNTGYYYNAEYGLYYDGNTGTYWKYNQETQSYDFHSQVQITQPPKEENKKALRKRKCQNGKKAKVKNSSNLEDLMHSFNKMKIDKLQTDCKRQREDNATHSPTKDIEEGECSDSGDTCSSDDDTKSDTTEISKRWPPCMRIIVENSDIAKVKIGSLHIITCDGGSMGREGSHSIVIPDLNTSKHHLKFTFDKESSDYFVTDLGSRNGTLLNGKRMSPSKQESEPMKITHGSKIQIGSTILLCHVHEGNQTCGHCEPGLIQIPKANDTEKISKTSRAERHKNELKNLRKMCGVVSYDEDPKLASGYTDRAQKRRETVGSQNPPRED